MSKAGGIGLCLSGIRLCLASKYEAVTLVPSASLSYGGVGLSAPFW